MNTLIFSLIAHGVDNMPRHNALNNTRNHPIKSASSPNDWRIINDNVMGGLSSGNVQYQGQRLIFSGTVSTQNNGGFTSIYKSMDPLDGPIKGVNVTLLGDGNAYQLRLRTQVDGNELTYKADFTSQKNKYMTIYFKLDDFEATFRGRLIENAPNINADAISHVGFLIRSDKTKTFRLSISEVEFY